MMKSNLLKTLCRFSLVVSGLAIASVTNAASINGMKVLSNEYTRIVFSADAHLQHHVKILNNPKRLVLDIKNAPKNDTIKMLGDHKWGKHQYISKTRIGKSSAKSSRVVFDLKSNVTHKVSTTTDAQAAPGVQHQLVLDIFKGY